MSYREGLNSTFILSNLKRNVEFCPLDMQDFWNHGGKDVFQMESYGQDDGSCEFPWMKMSSKGEDGAQQQENAPNPHNIEMPPHMRR